MNRFSHQVVQSSPNPRTNISTFQRERVGKCNADQEVEPPLAARRKLGKASPAVCEERVGQSGSVAKWLEIGTGGAAVPRGARPPG